MNLGLAATYVVPLVCLAYGLAAWMVQLRRVAPPRDWLLQRIWFLKAQIVSDHWGIGQDGIRDLEKVEKGITGRWLPLPVSTVQSGWRNVHGIEDQHVLELRPEFVDERLRAARTRLEAIAGSEAASLVKRIDTVLKDPHHQAGRAALLHGAEVFRHNHNDSNYENIAQILGKAVWLTWVTLGIIVALAAILRHESYFLLGAAGGLVSRLARVLRRRPKASDYGAEWSTLILSPAAGALAGWLGVLITHVLANDPFAVLTKQFSTPWTEAGSPLGLVLAFVFGFSERLFDRLLGVAENQVGAKLPQDDGKTGSDDEQPHKSEQPGR